MSLRRREKTSFVSKTLDALCFPLSNERDNAPKKERPPEREEEERMTTQSPPLQRGGGTTTPKEETTTTSSLKQHHNRQRRTLVIKSFKTAPKIPPRFLDRAWSERLRVALRAIHDQEPCEESHERIYRLVEDLVVGNFGAELYEKVKRAIEDRYVCFWVVPFSY